MSKHFNEYPRKGSRRLASFALLAAALVAPCPDLPEDRPMHEPTHHTTLDLDDRLALKALTASGEMLTAEKMTDEAGKIVFEVMPESLQRPSEF